MPYFYGFILKSNFYTMTIKATKIACTVSLLIAFFTQTSVSAQITASDTLVCQGTSVTLTADSGAFDMVTWGPAALISGSDSGLTINVTPQDTSTYFLYTLDTTGVADTNSITINTLPAPVNMSVSFQDSLCFREATTVELSGADSYEWISGNESFLDGTINDSVRTFTADSVLSGNNNYVVRGTIGTCTFDFSFRIRVLSANPRANEQNHIRDICFGREGRTVVAGGSTGAGTQFFWDDPDGILNTTTGTTVLPSPNDTTRVQTFSVTPVLQRCTGTVRQFEVQGLPSPTVSVTQSSGGNPVCLHGFDTITVTADHENLRFSTPRFSKFTTDNVQPISVNRTEELQVRVFGDRGCNTDTTLMLQLDPTCVDSTIFFLSVEELERLGLAQNIKVYQSGEELRLESELNLSGAEFMLVDMSGRIMNVQRITSGQNDVRLKLPANISKGIYIYRVAKDSHVVGIGKLPIITR